MIIFLDFDGVLHLEFIPGSTPGKVRVNTVHFTHLANFEAVLRDFPGIDIVISSTWRINHSLDELRSYFSDDIAARIIGVTPVLPTRTVARREMEIKQWLAGAGRSGERYLAIDDWQPLFSQEFDALFWVNPETAFDDNSSLALRQILLQT
jgi:hypothetical protein